MVASMSNGAATPAEKAKAYRLRAKVQGGGVLQPEEAEWYAAYEDARKRAHSMGASASKRTIHMEEEHMAVGTGVAAETAAAASLARAEGQRVDYLVRAGADSLIRACELHRAMAATMLDRMSQLETVHVALLDSVRAHYVARTEAEAALIRRDAEAEDDEGKELLFEMLRGAGGAEARRARGGGPPPRVSARRTPPPPRRPPPRA